MKEERLENIQLAQCSKHPQMPVVQSRPSCEKIIGPDPCIMGCDMMTGGLPPFMWHWQVAGWVACMWVVL